VPFAREPFAAGPFGPDLDPSPAGRPTPLGTHLAELIWFRSLTGAAHPYVEHARTGRFVTFGDLRRATTRWAGLLDDLGIGSGETVGIAVADAVDFSIVFLGVVAAGRVAAPLDPAAPDAELASVCGRVRPAVVLSDRTGPAGASTDWIVLRRGSFDLPDADLPDGATGWAPTLGTPSTSGMSATPRPADGGLVLSTSGTTGTPKLIRLTDRQLLHTARAIARHHRLSATDRGFNSLPLFHINAEVVGLLASLVAGATVVLDDRFHRTAFWADMARHRVTWINAVPAIIARLVPLAAGEVVPGGIRFVRSASAPLPEPTRCRFEDATGLPIVETYGMTEAGSQITANPLDGPRKPGSVGRPVGVELRVVADADADAETDSDSDSDSDSTVDQAAVTTGQPADQPVPATDDPVVGRVEIRGPGVIGAYAGTGYEDRVDAAGWLDSGDLGYLDEDGYLFLVGRADDVINRGGEKIFPREVEETILADPDVRAAVVVGWDHQVFGRVPVAFLVAEGVAGDDDRSRAEAIVDRLHGRCARDLSRPKRPVAFHVVQQLPAGPNGKIRRSMVARQEAIYSLLVS
jgi:acyl-CoA synthetase (AMP-forming)/AMP-acid ligase II